MKHVSKIALAIAIALSLVAASSLASAAPAQKTIVEGVGTFGNAETHADPSTVTDICVRYAKGHICVL